MQRKSWAERTIQVIALLVILVPYGLYLAWRELRSVRLRPLRHNPNESRTELDAIRDA